MGTNKKFIFHAYALFLIALLSRIILAEKIFYDADTIGVALATQSFSLESTRPHLPGYYLHVQSIKLINYFLNDVHSSMMFLTTAYFLLGALLSFYILNKFFNEKIAFVTSLLIIFNPLVWYQTITPEVYAFDFFFSALVFIVGNRSRYIFTLPLIFALATGFRQTSGVLLLPLYFYYWYKYYKSEQWNLKIFLLSHLTAVIIFLLWFIPFTNSAGGILEYFNLYKTNSPLPRINLLQHLFQFSSYLFYIAAPLVLVLLFALFRKKEQTINLKKIFSSYPIVQLILWVTLPLLAFTFFTYHKGYFLLIVTPLFFIVSILLNEKIINIPQVLFVVLLQILFFLFYPYQESSLESLYTPRQRELNITEVWIDRTFNSYLMANSRLEQQEENLLILFKIIYDNYSAVKNKFIFLDPTCYLYARAMQYCFQDINFITMDMFKKNYFVLYKGMDIFVKDGLEDILQQSVLITRKDFFDIKLSRYFRNKQYKDYLLLTDLQNDFTRLFNDYNLLFLR